MTPLGSSLFIVFSQNLTMRQKIIDLGWLHFGFGKYLAYCFNSDKGEQTVEVVEQLKVLIEQHLENFPNISVNALAAKTGVGATTIRRILNLSIKSDPGPHTVLSIVSTVLKETCLPRLLKSVDDPIATVLNKYFGHYTFQGPLYEYFGELDSVLEDTTCYIIYKLAANQSGTTLAHIKDLYGEKGLGRLKELVEAQLIFEDEEGRIHAREKNFSISLVTVKKHLPELVRFYKPEELIHGENVFFTLSESLNSDGIAMIRKIQKQAVKQIHEVVNDRQYQGKIPYMTINLGESMSSLG